jgi:hypothetical protein
VLTPSLASLVELYFYIKRLINRSLSKWLLGCAISPYIRSPFAFPLLFFLVQPIHQEKPPWKNSAIFVQNIFGTLNF